MVGRGPGGPPLDVNPWIEIKHGPLNLPNNLHDMPKNYLNIFHKFDREKDITTKDHMATFQDFTDNLFIEDDNVY